MSPTDGSITPTSKPLDKEEALLGPGLPRRQTTNLSRPLSPRPFKKPSLSWSLACHSYFLLGVCAMPPTRCRRSVRLSTQLAMERCRGSWRPTPSGGDFVLAFIFPACLLVVGGPGLSFASSGLLISNAVLPEEQGVAGSFISTVVQYSISIGLGIAVTVESHVNNRGQDPVQGSHGAFWLGTSFAAVGVFVVVFFIRDVRFESKGEVGDRLSSSEAIPDTMNV